MECPTLWFALKCCFEECLRVCQKKIRIFLFELRPLSLFSYMLSLSESSLLIAGLLSERFIIKGFSKEIYGFPYRLACSKQLP